MSSDQRWHDSILKNFHVKDESLKALFDVDSATITSEHKFKIKRPFVQNKVRKHFFSI